MPVEPPKVAVATRPLSILGILRAARRNVLEILPSIALTQPMVSGRTVARWHMVMDPGALRRVLLDNEANYPKSKVTLRMVRPAIGDSLFVAEGNHWRWQRRAVAPVFAHRHMMALAPYMSRAAARAADRIAARAPGVIDLYPEMVAATFDVICDVALSGNAALDKASVSATTTRYFETVGRVSLLDILNAPGWVPRPAQLFHRGGVSGMQRMLDRVIAERIAGERREDLLALMLEAADPETGRKMTPTELRDNLLAFLVAGHETTALALSWALYLAARDPETQARLVEEAAVIGDGPAEAAHLDRLPWHRQVIEEGMRLYPPVGMMSRTARGEDELCGRRIRKGDTVILPVYALHRHRMWWDRPDLFDPGNFDPDKVKARDRYLYLPFGGGPRICVGMAFAVTEAVLILATLMRRLSFAHVGHDPKPVMLLTLRPDGGVHLGVKARAPEGRPALAAAG